MSNLGIAPIESINSSTEYNKFFAEITELGKKFSEKLTATPDEVRNAFNNLILLVTESTLDNDHRKVLVGIITLYTEIIVTAINMLQECYYKQTTEC